MKSLRSYLEAKKMSTKKFCVPALDYVERKERVKDSRKNFPMCLQSSRWKAAARPSSTPVPSNPTTLFVGWFSCFTKRCFTLLRRSIRLTTGINQFYQPVCVKYKCHNKKIWICMLVLIKNNYTVNYSGMH